MNRFRNWLQRFMYGRYGQDQFGMFLSVIAIILFIVSMFTISYISYGATAILIYVYFRFLSRNRQARYRENQWFLKNTRWVRNIFTNAKSDYRIFKCPDCKQKLRVPKGRGRIEIRCRRCGRQFIKRT